MSDISMSDDDRRRAVESRFSEMFLANFTNAFGEAIEKMSPEQVQTLITKIEAVRNASPQHSSTPPPPQQTHQAPQRPVRLSAFEKYILGQS